MFLRSFAQIYKQNNDVNGSTDHGCTWYNFFMRELIFCLHMYVSAWVYVMLFKFIVVFVLGLVSKLVLFII